LPHAVATEPDVGARRGRDQTGAAAETEGVLQGARVVTELLATLGIVANRMRRAPRSWRLGFAHEAGGQETDVSIELDPSGRQLVFVAPVVRLPESAHEAMFRLLLTLNDETVGAFRLSLVGDLVLLSTMDFTHAVLKQKASKLLRELCVEAAHYRGLLHEAYGAEPVTALEG
jgi:hypothetical protein